MMTRKQYKLYEHIRETEPSPTYEEMGVYMGVNQKTCYDMVTRLVDARILERTTSPRSVKVVTE